MTDANKPEMTIMESDSLLHEFLDTVPQDVTIEQSKVFLARVQDVIIVHLKAKGGLRAEEYRSAMLDNDDKELDVQDKSARLATRPAIYQAQAAEEIRQIQERTKVNVPEIVQQMQSLSSAVTDLRRTVRELKQSFDTQIDSMHRTVETHGASLRDLKEEKGTRDFERTLDTSEKDTV